MESEDRIRNIMKMVDDKCKQVEADKKEKAEKKKKTVTGGAAEEPKILYSKDEMIEMLVNHIKKEDPSLVPPKSKLQKHKKSILAEFCNKINIDVYTRKKEKPEEKEKEETKQEAVHVEDDNNDEDDDSDLFSVFDKVPKKPKKVKKVKKEKSDDESSSDDEKKKTEEETPEKESSGDDDEKESATLEVNMKQLDKVKPIKIIMQNVDGKPLELNLHIKFVESSD